MKHFKVFDTKSEQDNYKILPCFSIIKNTENSWKNHSKEYKEKLLETPLTFEVLSNGNIVWNLFSNGTGITTGFTIEYKKNDGEWTEISAHLAEWIDDETYPSGGYHTGGTEIPVNTGDIVQFKGDNAAYCTYDDVTDVESNAFFNSTCQFKVYGNIMSLINSTDFSTITTLQSETTFNFLFEGCTGLTDAGNLLLPATTLTNNCYGGMFCGCTSLTTAPKLPATTLAIACYDSMFEDCTSLTTAPELPATTLANYCYQYMFSHCTSLTTAPELPATSLAPYCYSEMFYGCTSLTTAPKLPATTVAQSCYNYMFYGCTSLTTAPELQEIILANYCYYSMFYGCSNLNYIKCLATDISATKCTTSWVTGVASSGTFVKNASMTSWTTGVNGIPTGWTVQDAS